MSYPCIIFICIFQVESDNRMLIRHAHTGWPGSTHDARFLRPSSLYELGGNSNKIAQNKYILADSAYPIREWLVTPFRDNGTLNNNREDLIELYLPLDK